MSETGSANSGADGPDPAPQTVSCPSCKKAYRWKPELANRTAQCKSCGKVIRFPSSPALPPTLVETQPPAKVEEDDGLYDIRAEAPVAPKPVAPISTPAFQGTSGGAGNFPGMSRPKPAPAGRGMMTPGEGESRGVFVVRIIALILNGLLCAAGLLCILVCNPCGLVSGMAFGGVNLFWVLSADFNGTRRIMSIVLNSLGILWGVFLMCIVMLIEHLKIPTYTDVPVDAKTILRMIYIPLGSLCVAACVTALVHSGIRSTND